MWVSRNALADGRIVRCTHTVKPGWNDLYQESYHRCETCGLVTRMTAAEIRLRKREIEWEKARPVSP